LGSRSRLQAFTLVEILVTIALLAFITLGLFAALDQVQRAFRSGMGQVDRLEAGRAVTDLLPRELEQVTPSGGNAVTFAAEIVGSAVPPVPAPLIQVLPGLSPSGATQYRTNLLQDCFFLIRQNQTWVGIGYCVRVSDANGRLYLPLSGPNQLGVGSLYRYSASTNVLRNDPGYVGLPSDPYQLYLGLRGFRNACKDPLLAAQVISNRICDGVIYFRLEAFATNGFPIVLDTRSGTNFASFRPDPYSIGPRFSVVHPATVVPDYNYPGNISGLYFLSNAVPAEVGFELGLLEQSAWDRYNSIPAADKRLAYLQRSDVTSRVHLFRQRIPIRNVDPLAYQ
jgi:hypothetical protein